MFAFLKMILGKFPQQKRSALDITYFGSFQLSGHCIYVVNQCNEAYHIFQDQVQQEQTAWSIVQNLDESQVYPMSLKMDGFLCRPLQTNFLLNESGFVCHENKNDITKIICVTKLDFTFIYVCMCINMLFLPPSMIIIDWQVGCQKGRIIQGSRSPS